MQRSMFTKQGPSAGKLLSKNEALQVVRYQQGEFYREHYDNKAGNASARAATFMIYLSPVIDGGATYFPKAKSTSTVAAAVGDREQAALADDPMDMMPAPQNSGMNSLKAVFLYFLLP